MSKLDNRGLVASAPGREPIMATLPDLAARINAEHEAARGAFKKGFEHALNAGELLLQAKAQVEHGQWLPWLESNCNVSQRSAQLYMRVARERPKLEAKSASLADLSLEGAAKQLANPKQIKGAAPAKDEALSEVFGLLNSLVEITPITPDNVLVTDLNKIVETMNGDRGQLVDTFGMTMLEAQNAVAEAKIRCERAAGGILNELERRKKLSDLDRLAEEIRYLKQQSAADIQSLLDGLERAREIMKSNNLEESFDPWLKSELPEAFTPDEPLGFLLGSPSTAEAVMAGLREWRQVLAGTSP